MSRLRLYLWYRLTYWGVLLDPTTYGVWQDKALRALKAQYATCKMGDNPTRGHDDTAPALFIDPDAQ